MNQTKPKIVLLSKQKVPQRLARAAGLLAENNKESVQAKAVAQEVKETVSNGKPVNLRKIQQKHGYTLSSARAMKATRTKTYQREIQPLLKQLEDHRDEILRHMRKKVGKAKYNHLVEALDKVTKNHQLLSGRSTSNTAVLHLEPGRKAELDQILNENN